MTPLRHVLPALVLALAAGTASAQNYSFSELPSNGTRYWSPSGINNLGQVVGTVGDTHYPYAVTWDANHPSVYPTYLPTYAECCTYTASWGTAINDRGQVAGEDTYRAALWNGNARPTLLHGDPPPQSSAYDLNESGGVVGHIGWQAALWDASGTHMLSTLGGSNSAAHAINEAGTIVGLSTFAGPGYSPHAVVWHNGAITDLGAGSANDLNDLGLIVGTLDQRAVQWNGTQATFLGGIGSVAIEVNNSGWVVGSVFDEFSGDPARAMLWRDGRAIDLNSFLSQAERDAGWQLVSANAINDKGWIVGSAINSRTSGGTGFLLSIPAIPEPASIAMLLAGLAVIGAAARRSRRNAPCA